MAFDFASVKSTARRKVHATFGVQAFYSDDSVSDREIKVRWHNKKTISNGELGNGDGYAAIVEGIDRIIFERKETETQHVILDVDEADLTIARNGQVRIPSLNQAAFVLDTMLPEDGPIDEIWSVTRK